MGVEAQTRQSLENRKDFFETSGVFLDIVIKTTVFLSDMNIFTVKKGVCREFFCDEYPARSVFKITKLLMDALAEIECIALFYVFPRKTRSF